MNDFYVSVTSDLDLSLFDIKFTLPVSPAQGCLSKL